LQIEKLSSADRLMCFPGDLETRVPGMAGYTTAIQYKGNVNHLLSLFNSSPPSFSFSITRNLILKDLYYISSTV